MPEENLPIYKIQDFKANAQRERYFYLSTFAAHLQEHLFIQKAHKHDFYIILFITRGTGVHTIDFKKYPVGPNMVFLMTPGQVHSWDLSADADGYILFFTPEFYLQEVAHKNLHSFPFFRPLIQTPALAVSGADEAALLQVVRMLEQEHVKQALLKDEMLRRYLDILFIMLTRIFQAKDLEKQLPQGTHPQLQRLEVLIDQHFQEHLPVHFYAAQLHVTTKQLNDTCKRSLGKTTSDLIQERTILEAQRLLVHSDLSITQLAAELGYYDAAYFFRFFKKHTGMTPEQFRSTHH